MKYATNLNLQQNELQNARVQNLTGEPDSPVKGQIFFDSSANKLKVYNGTSWESAGTQTISVTWDDISGKPTKLSEFTNDGVFITKAASDLTNYYLKTETYTQDEVNTLIGNLATIQVSVVSSLPSTGESNIIYLVAKSTSETQNVYDEYLWTGSAFEHIGDTAVDLTNYLTKTGDGSDLNVNGENLGTTITTLTSSIENIGAAVTTQVETLSAATGTYTVSGYIIGVTLIDSSTKEQVLADITYGSFTDSANPAVTVTCASAPTNALKVIISYIAS